MSTEIIPLLKPETLNAILDSLPEPNGATVNIFRCNYDDLTAQISQVVPGARVRGPETPGLFILQDPSKEIIKDIYQQQYDARPRQEKTVEEMIAKLQHPGISLKEVRWWFRERFGETKISLSSVEVNISYRGEEHPHVRGLLEILKREGIRHSVTVKGSDDYEL